MFIIPLCKNHFFKSKYMFKIRSCVWLRVAACGCVWLRVAVLALVLYFKRKRTGKYKKMKNILCQT